MRHASRGRSEGHDESAVQEQSGRDLYGYHRKAGLRSLGWACGVCIGDYNNDGFDDIFCTNFGQNVLYRNNGDGTFTDVTKAAGLWSDQQRFGAGCTFVDYDRDGYLDLFVSNYVRFSFENAAAPAKTPTVDGKEFPSNAAARVSHGQAFPLSKQWRWNVH